MALLDKKVNSKYIINNYIMKSSIISILLFLQVTIVSAQKDFSFVFLPDLHLRSDSAVLATFEKTVLQVNSLHPDFVITGGDMIYTAKNVNDMKAKILFDLMDSEFKKFDMPVYLTKGNHEIVGVLAESGIDSTNPNYGNRMYEQRYGNRYKTFMHSDWKFFLLDGIKIVEKVRNYSEEVDSIQINWIKKELSLTDRSTPIVVIIHPPFINPEAILSSGRPVMSKKMEEVLNLFKGYNLKIVLFGHNHTYMNLYLHGVHYIEGGSTSDGTPPFDDGFLFIRIKNGVEDIQFIHPSGSKLNR
jgi:3',5'-cyclic AMP phosphodiesterase CpdA